MSQDIAEIKGPNGHQYLDEVKAAALELMQQGHSARAVALELHVEPRTIQRWAQRWRQVDPATDLPILMDNWTRIVHRAQQKMHDYLDYLDEHPEEISKHSLPANVYAGTGTDKLIRAREMSKPPSLSQVLIVVNAQPPAETVYDERGVGSAPNTLPANVLDALPSAEATEPGEPADQ